MRFDPNGLFYWMAKTYADNKTPDNKIIFCNEGSSRSSKTWDAIHFIVMFCLQNQNANLQIGCFRDTLKNSRERLYEKDFKLCLKHIGIYNHENARKENQSPEYYLFGNKIEFRGLDDETEQVGYDIVFVNEALELKTEALIAGLKMRCRKLMIFDWNPKFTMHWIFDYEKQPNVFFSRTTYKNNKHLERSIITDIESKSPWHLDDLHLPESERRPNLDNVQNGTADYWFFKVYGLGERANREGLVFPNVTWHDEMTTECDKYFFGLDFGNTTGIYALSYGAYNHDGIWFDDPIYGSFATKQDIDNDSNSGLKNFWTAMKAWLDSKGWKDYEIIIVSDSAQPQKINDLNRFAINDGYNCKFVPCKKFPGCIKWRIDIIKRHKLNLVKRDHTKIEQENYTYKTINGIALDEPIDDFNHAWDAKGYSIQYQDYLRA